MGCANITQHLHRSDDYENDTFYVDELFKPRSFEMNQRVVLTDDLYINNLSSFKINVMFEELSTIDPGNLFVERYYSVHPTFIDNKSGDILSLLPLFKGKFDEREYSIRVDEMLSITRLGYLKVEIGFIACCGRSITRLTFRDREDYFRIRDRENQQQSPSSLSSTLSVPQIL